MPRKRLLTPYSNRPKMQQKGKQKNVRAGKPASVTLTQDNKGKQKEAGAGDTTLAGASWFASASKVRAANKFSTTTKIQGSVG
jgi:hypothetical protein